MKSRPIEEFAYKTHKDGNPDENGPKNDTNSPQKVIDWPNASDKRMEITGSDIKSQPIEQFANKTLKLLYIITL